MNEEEPAWRAELEAQIRKFDAFGMPFIVPILEPFIRAAEQRGRREALTEAAEKIRDSVSHLKDAGPTATSVWAITTQAADLIDPEQS